MSNDFCQDQLAIFFRGCVNDIGAGVEKSATQHTYLQRILDIVFKKQGFEWPTKV